MDKKIGEKYKKLTHLIKEYGKICIAFSGGTDSTFLLKVSSECLGKENVLAVTAVINSFPLRELNYAKDFCEKNGFRHVTVEADQSDVSGFSDNTPDRCYLCKNEICSKIKTAASENGFVHIADGSNSDDDNDYRPGIKAVAEHGFLTPLKDLGFSKNEVRICSKELGIEAWDRQSFSCLASRIPYGEKITPEKLDMIGQAEQFLLDCGIKTVRVRIQGERGCSARIETGTEDFGIIMSKRDDIILYFKRLGFFYVSLDLSGYRTGSMNAVLEGEQ